MARSRTHTRRTAKAQPRGILDIRSGGFGFVKTAEGEFFIPKAKLAGAAGGDLVEVAPLPGSSSSVRGRRHQAHQGSQKKPAARVVRIVERAHNAIVGRYEVAEPFGVVVPEDHRIPYDIFTMRADHPEIDDGALVRVRVTTFPTRNTAATGVIEEVLDAADAEAVPIELLVARHKLETRFSEGSLAEAQAATLDEAGALSSGYRDVRDRFTFTIDPDDARDFDDALSIERVDGEVKAHASGITSGIRVVDTRGVRAARWRVGVHIADVSHYVPWNSSIDLDARRRATSVYLADRVIPMLPEELSGDLCSLRPHEVRRTMTADLYLDDQARLVAYELYPALIRSKARLTYGQAQAVLFAQGIAEEGPDDSVAEIEQSDAEGELSWRLAELSRIATARQALRQAAGGLDFNTTEAKVRLDSQGYPVAIDIRRKTLATALVEEAMILANETVAQHLTEADFPSLYRVHEQPSADSLAALVPVFQEFAWFSDIDQAGLVAGNAQVLQQVLALSAPRPEGELVSSLLLRAMKRAVYRPTCEGHYGLASQAYTHFTSPIRRYPDLVVHRMLKAQMTRRSEKFDQEVAALPWIAEHSSDAERVAEKAARESQEVKIVEYMEPFIGQAFPAVISGVAPYGVYVRLENTAEGLVAIRDLGDEYFALDAVLHSLTGQETATVYRLGQRIPVVLIAADARNRRLDFRLARPKEHPKTPRV